MKKPISGSQRDHQHARPPTPPRVAPRLSAEVKRMRVRSKKTMLSDKK